MKPIIGIPATPKQPIPQLANNAVIYSPQNYIDAVTQAGGIAVLLNPNDPEDLPELMDVCAGFLLTGGQDVTPLFYGEEPHVKLGTTNYQRDLFEISLTKAAIAAHKPLLGICRGMQVINVALGGTLWQDIGENTAAFVKHQQYPTSWTLPTHSVSIAPDSPLAFLGESTLTNSFHHQALRDLAPAWHAIAHSADGVIEATYSAKNNVLGVQWHPEGQLKCSPEQLGIFKWLVNQSKAQ